MGDGGVGLKRSPFGVMEHRDRLSTKSCGEMKSERAVII